MSEKVLQQNLPISLDLERIMEKTGKGKIKIKAKNKSRLAIRILVAALLSGPESRELTRVIPEDFMVNSVRVDEGICYVNISAASLASLPEDEAAQRLILWSLADSLYSLEAVEELRLLSDGQELTHFGLVPVSTVAVRPQG